MNNFSAERTKKLEAKLFQVRALVERTSSAKLDEMLSLMRLVSDQIGLGYDFSSSNIVSSSTTVFVSSTNNVNSENNDVKFVFASENIDKGKSILGAPLQLDKVVTKNPKAKKSNNQNSKQKKRHLCHHCGASRHT